jgi:Fe-S oxidoreductase
MARMKLEFLAHYKASRGHSARDRAIAFMPRYAPMAARLAPLANLASRWTQRAIGFADRPLPHWRRDYFRDLGVADGDVVLFVDTFNRYFEPENARAAKAVLEAAGHRVQIPSGICCGRTYLSVGMADRAKREAAHLLNTLAPAIARGVPIIGLEPSCLYALRDELPALIPGAAALAKKVVHFAEWIAARPGKLAFREADEDVLLHGHCHEKAFDAMGAVQRALALVPGLKVSTVETSCCGMAGSFGYEAEHAEVSMRMAEMTLLPAIRKAPGAMLVADGTSCRHQILDGTGRKPLHIARVLEAALSAP